MPTPKKKYEYKRATFYFNGKQYNVTGKTQGEADRKAALKEQALIRGEAVKGGNMTVSVWAHEWLEVYKRPGVGEAQYKNYLTFINAITKAIGHKSLKDVTETDLQKFINGRAGRSKSDLTKIRAVIQAVFHRAHKSRLILYNPAEDLTLPAAENGSWRSITDTERSCILRLAETHYAGLWVRLLLGCGIRPGESRALDVRHINFDKQRLHVEGAMKAGTRKIGKTKTDAGARDIPIPDHLIPHLKAVCAGKSPFDPIFTKPLAGGRHDKGSMEHMWNNFKRELDIMMGAKLYRNQIITSTVASDLVPYCLRHTYGTDLQDAGVPLNVAKYLMGHKNISVTANIYTDTTEVSISAAAEKINSYAEHRTALSQ